MDKIAFTIFGIPIMWYGITAGLAILAGLSLSYYLAQKHGGDSEIIVDAALWCLPAAIIGARAYYVIFEWEYYSQHISEIINIRQGGMAIHGALIAAILVGYIFAKKRKVNFYLYMDFIAPAIILGQAIGRWGNFFNQEAHGGPTTLPWGILIDGVRVHPTFLYESIWNIIVCAFLVWLISRKKFDGQIFFLYGILYSVARFFIEGLRTDSLMFLGMRQAQLISVGIIIVFSIWYMYRKKKYTKDM